MGEYYLSAKQSNGSLLCLAPLTNRQISMSDLDIEDTSGMFLFEHHGPEDAGEVRVIARVLSEDAVLMFREMFELA